MFARKLSFNHTLLVLLCAVALFCIALYGVRACEDFLPQVPVISSHGMNIWFGDTLKTFAHTGGRICVPDGFEPLGAIAQSATWARFELGASAVFVSTEAFNSSVLPLSYSPYSVRAVYLKDTPPETLLQYESTITNAFTKVAPLYVKNDAPAFEHTVLITPGVAGDGNNFETSVYPDPGAHLSIIVRPPSHVRSEELYIHAVAHLYNRYHKGENTPQTPIPMGDWEELEASWTEIAFRTSKDERRRLVNELYDVHTAVHKGAYAETLIFPFNIQEIFNGVTQKSVAITPGSEYPDYQYGHYVVAPLVLLGIEALLEKSGAPFDVASMLTKLHTESNTEVVPLLREVLGDDDITRTEQWMQGVEIVPYELVLKALEYYEQQ